MSPRLRILVFFSSLLLLARIVAADTIQLDPPNATANRSIDATVAGVWSDSCVPSIKNVVITGATITLHLNADVPPDSACLQALTQYHRTFHLGVVPAGSYTVIAVADQGATSREVARVPLFVRDAETLNIAPYAVPASGGEIVISNPFFLAGATITIGGVAVPANSNVDGLLIANAPAHVPGAVDIVVNSTAGTLASKAALIYYDPASADPAVFEPILLPLSFQGPGAFGSQWTTDTFITTNGAPAYFRDALPCAGCSASISIGTKQFTNNSDPWGHVLYAMRGTAAALDFASRIHDTSRQAQTAGTEVPIARERDFRGLLRFLNIPSDNRYRAMIRLWSLGDYPQFIVIVDSIPAQLAPLSVTKIPGTAMWFGAIDVTSLLTKGITNPTSVMVYPSGYGSFNSPLLFPQIWGMLSITNNDTQQVTIISPH